MNELKLVELDANLKPLRDADGNIKHITNSTVGDMDYLQNLMNNFSTAFPSNRLAIIEIQEDYKIIQLNPAANSSQQPNPNCGWC